MKIDANAYYIVRSDRAGVFFGHITEQNGQEVTLTECRRIWRWDGACSLSQLAAEGVKKPNECKFSVTVDSLTVLDTIEIIPCTDKAVANIKGVWIWKI